MAVQVYHIVFTPKYRRKVMYDNTVRRWEK